MIFFVCFFAVSTAETDAAGVFRQRVASDADINPEDPDQR